MTMIKRRKEDTIVLIDDKYASLIARQVLGQQQVGSRIRNLSMNLAKSRNLWCDEIRLYVGGVYESVPPTQEESIRKVKHEKFVKALESQKPRTYVRQGRCQK